MKELTIDTIFYPGSFYDDEALDKLTSELRLVAQECFSDIPHYQALTGEREEFKRIVLATARNKTGELVGFCSSLILNIPDKGYIFHTGLTCVSPRARGKKLTHKLSSKLLLNYLIQESPFSKIWVSNCACVLSSLGNVALYFEDIYPSPYGKSSPSKDQIAIAEYISQYYREPIAIDEKAKFNAATFVFEGSVKDSAFVKNSNDIRYHHRNASITNFYKNLMNFENGDEVLQVGQVSLMTFPKYLWSKSKRKYQFIFSQLNERLS